MDLLLLPVLALGPVGVGPLDTHVAADVLEGDALHAELALQEVFNLCLLAAVCLLLPVCLVVYIS